MAQPSLSLHECLVSERSSPPSDRAFLGLSPTTDSDHVLAKLRTIISDGSVSLDAMLQHIVEAAQMVTCANGAAIAICRDDFVICRARAGDMAPDLDTKLDTDSGISGQCLRTAGALRCDDTNNDTRVDPEVCRRLGLRSLAAVPVGRIPAVSGVLETFSALPDAFCDTHLELLKELADLVIAAQRRSVESFARTASQEAAIAPRQSWAKRGLVLATAAGLALLGWVSLRGKLDGSHFSAARPQPITSAVVANRSVDAVPAVVSKPDVSPTVPVRETKPGLPTGVVTAIKSEKTAPEEDVIVRKFGPDTDSNPKTAVRVPASLSTAAAHSADSPGGAAPPALGAVSTSVDTALSRLLSVPHYEPQVAPRVSQGISGGTIERRVIPVYPRRGLERRIEGRVLLQAVVTQDGTLRDLKVLNGDPMLARAAVEAVAQWRYRPYRLNGTPISTQTKIAVVFKLP